MQPAPSGWLEDAGSRDDLEGAAGDVFGSPSDPHRTGDATQKKKKKSGGFQVMGLGPELLKAILRQGYNVPTPIQRKAIPPLMDGSDVVAMARTGSGKTAAYLIPMLHRLKEHSNIMGIRAIILSPTRELSLQIIRNVRLLGQHLNLRAAAIVGGVGLEAQFADLASNPDIVVASPGRLLHLCEETGMTLARVQSVILDEADRLFELGLQPQIVALLQKLPDNAQRALFSATMPSVLAEFARAGLTNPIVIRLDSESRLSDKLTQAAFIVRSAEKYAALLFVLKRLVNVEAAFVPVAADGDRMEGGSTHGAGSKKRGRIGAPAAAASSAVRSNNKKSSKKQQQDEPSSKNRARAHGTLQPPLAETTKLFKLPDAASDGFPQALVFVESKHQADFVDMLLRAQNISSVAVHGHMDQEARRLAVSQFARKSVAVMVTTDVAARGLDLPLLDYVINFSFPFSAKLFIHRVGRVARAGRSGVALSLLTMDEFPFYVEAMRFFNKSLVCHRPATAEPGAAATLSAMTFNPADGCFGRLPELELQIACEATTKAIAENIDLRNQHTVAQNGLAKFTRTRRKAAVEDVRVARQFAFDLLPVHPVFESVTDRSVIDRTAAVMDLRRFKPKNGESYLESINEGQVLFRMKPKVTLQSLAADRRKLQRAEDAVAADPMLQQVVAAAAAAAGPSSSSGVSLKALRSGTTASVPTKPTAVAPLQKSPAPPARKLTLAEALLEKARQRKAGQLSSGDHAVNETQGHQNNTVFSHVTALLDTPRDGASSRGRGNHTDHNGQNGNEGMAYYRHDAATDDHENSADAQKYRDREFFLDDRQQQMADATHFTLRDATLDIAPETAQEAAAQRKVFAWNKKKNRFVKMAVNDAKAMLKGIKNEAGKMIDFKNDKHKVYAKWTQQTGLRIQDVGENEDEGVVNQAIAFRKRARTTGNDEEGGANDGGGGDEDIVDISDPNQGKTLRIGRKIKRLPAGGRVRSFEDLRAEKKKAEKEKARMARKSARRSQKKQM